MNVSIVVPVYNEQDNILPLAAECAQLTAQLPGLEVLLVDDGSRDQTWARIAEAHSRFPCVHGLRYERNRGQSSAMLLGMTQAAGELLVTIDGDLQNNPADIPRLVAEAADCDVVCGYRAKRRDTWARRAGSRIANRVRNWCTHDGIRDTGCSLKAFRAEYAKRMKLFRGMHRFLTTLVRMQGGTVVEVDVNHRPRPKGTPKYGQGLGRTFTALRDAWAVRWMQSRGLNYDAEEL